MQMPDDIMYWTFGEHSEDPGVAWALGLEAGREAGGQVLMALKLRLRPGLILLALSAWGSGGGRGLREAGPAWPRGWEGGGPLRLGGLERLICKDRGSSL